LTYAGIRVEITVHDEVVAELRAVQPQPDPERPLKLCSDWWSNCRSRVAGNFPSLLARKSISTSLVTRVA